MIAAFVYAVALLFPLFVPALGTSLALGIIVSVVEIVWPDNFAA